jgi:hypothetical protein
MPRCIYTTTREIDMSSKIYVENAAGNRILGTVERPKPYGTGAWVARDEDDQIIGEFSSQARAEQAVLALDY